MAKGASRKDGPEGTSRRRKLMVIGKHREELIEDLLSKCAHCNSGTLDEFVELESLLTKIKLTEEELFETTADSRKLHFDNFVKWCTANGIDSSKVTIFPVDEQSEEFGLKAATEVAEDELVLSIPRKLMLTTESALKDVKFANFVKEDPIVKTMPNVLLALHLINEFSKKSDSFWAPYIRIFPSPSKYSTPLYLGVDDMKQFKHSPWFEEAVKLYRSIGRQYAYFWKQMNLNKSAASQLPFKNCFTYELYRWAVSTVMTRQNFVPSPDGERMVNALIPLWDMANHCGGKFSTDFDLAQDAAVCFAMRTFKQGDEINIFYGNRSNGEFFIHNGFVYTHNEHDFIPLKLGISKNDALFSLKSALCVKLGFQPSGVFKLYKKSTKALDEKLLWFLRIFNMTREQLDNCSNQQNLSELSSSPLEFVELDAKVDKFLVTRASLLLRAYQTAQEADTKAHNQTIATLLRCEKEILESYTETTQAKS